MNPPPSARRPILRLESVSRTYGSGAAAVHALTDADFELYAGELVAIMGASGSGKSTLLSIAGGLDRPTAGEVRIEGTPTSAMSVRELAVCRRRTLGYVFQQLNLIPSLTSVENVSMPLELDGVSTRKARAAALTALETVGMSDQVAKFPDQMSGGQCQRVAIARALVGDRRIVLADEPTGALDSVTGEQILMLLRELADSGRAVALVTHEPRFAGWADRVVYLRDGRISGHAGSMVGQAS